MNPGNDITYDEAIVRIVTDEPDIFGRIQIVFFTGGQWYDRIATFFAGILGRRSMSEADLARELVVMVGPNVDLASGLEVLKDAIIAAADRLEPTSAMTDQARRVIDTVRLIEVSDWSLETLVDSAALGAAGTVVAVVRAADYRDATIITTPLSSAAPLLGSDEVWAPHILAVAKSLASIAHADDMFFLLDTGRPGPADELLEPLRGVPNCQILSAPQAGPEVIIDRRMPQWREWLGLGRLGPVLQELDAISGMDDLQRRIVRIQILDVAGLADQALSEIRAIESFAELPANVSARLAKIAAEANAVDLARTLLRFDLDQVVSREDVQNTLQAAARIGDEDLAGRAESKLEALFPDSTALANHRRNTAIERGDHRAAAAAMLGKPGSAELIAFHLRVADAFDSHDVPDYASLIDEAGADALLASRYRLASTDHALRRGLIVHAFELLMTPEAIVRGEGSRSLIQTIEQLLIHRPSGVMAVDEDRVDEAVAVLVQRMGQSPGNGALRASLIDLLDPKIVGDLGRILLLKLLIKLAFDEVIPKARTVPPAGPSLSEILADDGFKAGLETWMKIETPIRVGRTVFPKDALPASADAICHEIIDHLDRASQHAKAGDHEDRLLIVALCAAIAPHASELDLDLKAIRTAAAGMVIAGSGQPARDLIESMIDHPTTPRRRRLAWFGLADVYHRGHNILLAALYACAGMLADEDVDEDQFWHEVQVIHRILRDVHLVGPALGLLDHAKLLLDRMGLHDEYAHRIVTMAILTRFANPALAQHEDSDLREMIAEAVANGRAVLSRKDTPGPISSLLAQLLRKARERGIELPADAIAMDLELRASLDGSLAAHIEIYAKDAPTSDDLLVLLRATGAARYSDDVGKDAHAVTMAAARALDADSVLADPDKAVFTLEMTTDRAVAAPGWDGARVPPPIPIDATEPADTARAMSSAGTAVIVAGFARDGSLVRVATTNGVTEPAVREDRSLFARDRFDAWRARFPYDYGMDESFANRFFVTTQSLRFAALPPGPTVLIADTKLSSFPPNLLRIGNGFAGLEQPMAAAPSLSWLKAARAHGNAGDGRRVAWISGAETRGTTLTMISDRLAEPFSKHGFHLDRGARLPTNFQGASLAVIAAHGGLNQTGSAFQVVSDEGQLAVSVEELASALHNVAVVVLFVCSGGRSDTHPAADATLGLARDILDNGSSAVVASPWPIDSIVPARWLPVFLARWDAGDRLIESVFEANKAVLGFWPHDLAKGLAMTVIGNPEVCAK